ncbi:TNFAIP3-interacting protein 3 [Suricata suricatta]|uniref:TNFAIP3-interacting protein 3 n=1 Tax=Suricata suricatta TaxID=37032 RepID=UPI001155C727|nr:TNFAIP3-interacting protein 3 [Suricata suricatta]
MIPYGQRINKNEKHEERLVMFTNQQEDSERCESMELDNKIRDMIERNDSPDLKGATPGATPRHRNSCSLKQHILLFLYSWLFCAPSPRSWE